MRSEISHQSTLRKGTPRASLLRIVVSLQLSAATISTSYAQERNDEVVTVTVRTIEAQGSLPPTQVEDTTSQEVAHELKDLSSKLSQIPYRSFRLVSSKEERVCLKKRQSMQLPNGQSLSFRPIYMEGKKVGLWLNWKDSDGAGILDTRIHFDSDDSVITGTDQSPDSGTILAIKAAPIVRKTGYLLHPE